MKIKDLYPHLKEQVSIHDKELQLLVYLEAKVAPDELVELEAFLEEIEYIREPDKRQSWFGELMEYAKELVEDFQNGLLRPNPDPTLFRKLAEEKPEHKDSSTLPILDAVDIPDESESDVDKN